MNGAGICINNIDDISKTFSAALERLGASKFKIEIDGHGFPISVVTHPHFLLGRLAMKAEEIAIMIFGVRIFPDACFTAKPETPTGFIVEHRDALSLKQMEDVNILSALEIPSASIETMTLGHRELIIEAAVTQTLEVDREKRLVRIKPQDIAIHNLFRNGPRFESGDGIPMLMPDMIALNDLHNLLSTPYAALAINKAREVAEQLARQRQKSLDKDSGGLDV